MDEMEQEMHATFTAHSAPLSPRPRKFANVTAALAAICSKEELALIPQEQIKYPLTDDMKTELKHRRVPELLVTFDPNVVKAMMNFYYMRENGSRLQGEWALRHPAEEAKFKEETDIKRAAKLLKEKAKKADEKHVMDNLPSQVYNRCVTNKSHDQKHNKRRRNFKNRMQVVKNCERQKREARIVFDQENNECVRVFMGHMQRNLDELLTKFESFNEAMEDEFNTEDDKRGGGDDSSEEGFPLLK